MIVDIQPTTIAHIGVKVEIRIPDFQLGATTGLAVGFVLNEQGGVVKAEQITLPAEIYAQWGQDDRFIADYVLQQMNLIAADE